MVLVTVDNWQKIGMTDTERLILVTGPVRSGKSEWAENWAGNYARNYGKSVIYIATSGFDDHDPEWGDRIQKHRDRRPSDWTTLEVPITLSTTLASVATADNCILVDSLGTWLANLLDWEESQWEQAVTELLQVLLTVTGPVILVAEEVGWGLVPPYPLGRLFRDRLGGLVRLVGTHADSVYLVTGGYALDLTRLGVKISPD